MDSMQAYFQYISYYSINIIFFKILVNIVLLPIANSYFISTPMFIPSYLFFISSLLNACYVYLILSRLDVLKAVIVNTMYTLSKKIQRPKSF